MWRCSGHSPRSALPSGALVGRHELVVLLLVAALVRVGVERELAPLLLELLLVHVLVDAEDLWQRLADGELERQGNLGMSAVQLSVQPNVWGVHNALKSVYVDPFARCLSASSLAGRL